MDRSEENLIEIIDDIENFVEEEGTTNFFTPGRVTVEKETLMVMISRLRESVPNEIVRGKEIMEEQKKILDEAQETAKGIVDSANAQADKIINDAVEEATSMVEESEIVKLAQKRASEIEAEANDYADDTVAKAKAEAKQYRLGAMEYTRETVAGLEDYVVDLRESYDRIHAELDKIHDQLVQSTQKDIDEFAENRRQVENQISRVERER